MSTVGAGRSKSGGRQGPAIPMTERPPTPLLDTVQTPDRLRALAKDHLRHLAAELREETTSSVSETGGPLGAGLGVVSLTVAAPYVFKPPRALIVWRRGPQ